MNVLFVITKSEHGGAQTHVWQLVSCLQSEGYRAHITAHAGGWLEDQALQHGVPFHPNNFLTNSPCPIGGLRAAREIVRLVRQIAPDIVHCHSSAAGLWGRLGVRRTVPTIFTAHGWGFGEGAPALRRVALLAAERAVARYTDAIICVSDYDRRLALRAGIASQEKVVVIHNGVEARHAARPERTVNSRIRAVFVGRLARPKEPELLLEALAELPERSRNAYELTIVGDGPLLAALRARASSLPVAVRFTGALPRAEVLNVLRESSVLVLASRHEGFPMSILEGMSMGLAVIASDVGGIGEAVTVDSGILVRRGDKKALSQALARLADNPVIISRLGTAARERVMREFSVSSMCAKTMSLYESVRTP